MGGGGGEVVVGLYPFKNVPNGRVGWIQVFMYRLYRC